MDSQQPLESVLADSIRDTDGETVSVGNILKLYEDRTFGPIFALLGLLVVVPPIGAIPVLPAIIGAVILLFSLQKLFGRTHVWAPGFLRERSISKSSLKAAEKKAGPVLARLDSLMTDRLQWAASGASRYVATVLVSVLAAVLIPLELVPFAVALPGAAIALIGVALIARDGLLMLLAYVLSAAAFIVLWRFI